MRIVASKQMLKDDNEFRTADDVDPRTALLFGFSLETEWETPILLILTFAALKKQTFELMD